MNMIFNFHQIGPGALALMMLLGATAPVGCFELDEPGAATSAGGAGGTGGALPAEEAALTREQLLGKRLFEDTSLSEPPGQACASCHDAAYAYTGTDGSSIPAVAQGSRPEQHGRRNVPTIMYASFSPPFGFLAEAEDDGSVSLTPVGGQFWDGRASSLAEQALGPFLNPREMNNPDKAAVVAKIAAGAYGDLFRAAYGQGALDDPDAAYELVGRAIAAFEVTPRFHPFSSRFDAYLRGEAQLSDQEARGFALFKDPEKGNCIACHAGNVDSRNPSDWLFTDFTFDALGLPRNASLPDNDDPKSFDLGLCDQPGLAGRAPAGLDTHTLCGAFKVPTLRNIARTAPYGHNGFFAELRDVVRFYATRDTNPELWYPRGADGEAQKLDDLPPEYRANVNTSEVPYDRRPGDAPRLSEEEIDAVVAFLEALSDQATAP
jgi:cytochrome c peroxidase